jgi:energy-coupling factor transporter ATP-binding protein EcfA2
MPTAFAVRALTSTVRIELDDTISVDEREWIRAQWSDLIVDDSEAPTRTLRGSTGDDAAGSDDPDVKLIRTRTAEHLADWITSDVTQVAIRRLSGEALMLHAAAVSLDDGRVIGFIGPSGRGKTTAAKALGSAYGYITDETLAVRADGSVVPYEKPLSLVEARSNKHPQAGSALGLRPAPNGELRLAALVLLDRRPGIDRPYVESVPLVEGLPELVQQTSYLSRLAHPLRSLAEAVVSTGGLRRVVYSEAEALPGLVEVILDTVDDEQPRLTDVASSSRRDCDCFTDLLPTGAVTMQGAFEDAPPGTYRRVDHTDALLIDDSLLVMSSHEVTMLEGVGPVVWLAANDSTEDDLRAAALRQLPEPPEGVDTVQVVGDVLQQLVDARLLARR